MCRIQSKEGHSRQLSPLVEKFNYVPFDVNKSNKVVEGKFWATIEFKLNQHMSQMKPETLFPCSLVPSILELQAQADIHARYRLSLLPKQ